MQVNILEAKNRLSELVRAVEAGEEVVLARRGVPVIRMTAIGRESLHPAGSRAAVLALLREPRPAGTQRSTAEIDADVADMKSAWD